MGPAPAMPSRVIDKTVSGAPRAASVARPQAVRIAVLARAAAGGHVAHSDLVRDLTPFLSQRLSAAAIRDLLTAIVADLAAADLVIDERGRITLTDAGLADARAQLAPAPLPKDWAALRDCRLVPVALGLAGAGVAALKATQLKAIATPDGLRAAILRTTHAPQLSPGATTATLRTELAMVALARAFGDDVRGQIRARDGLSAKTARALASRLARRPREAATDQKLIATLAAEAVGAFQTDADALRTAVLRRWMNASMDAVERSAPIAPSTRHAAEVLPTVVVPAAASRPGFDAMIALVLALASEHAEGWSGNRKAYVSRVLDAMTLRHPGWAMDEAEFKAMLVEAHRLGRIALATADLKTKDNLPELARSEIAYRNAVLHFIRVDE